MNNEQKKQIELAHVEILKALADLQRVSPLNEPEKSVFELAVRRLLSAEVRVREIVEFKDF